jgi:hypothetical protein
VVSQAKNRRSGFHVDRALGGNCHHCHFDRFGLLSAIGFRGGAEGAAFHGLDPPVVSFSAASFQFQEDPMQNKSIRNATLTTWWLLAVVALVIPAQFIDIRASGQRAQSNDVFKLN